MTVSPEPFPKPTWDVPTPYGYENAATVAGSVAAPLLAGFTVSLIGIVIGYGKSILMPGPALDLLSAAAVTLIASVQLHFKAKTYFATPSELEAWWPDHATQDRRARLLLEQASHAAAYRRWICRFRWAYNCGVVLLLAGIAVILVPPSMSGAHLIGRLIASGVVVVGLVGELVWIATSRAEGLVSGWWSRSDGSNNQANSGAAEAGPPAPPGT